VSEGVRESDLERRSKSVNERNEDIEEMLRRRRRRWRRRRRGINHFSLSLQIYK
jgi:hypothetical protein